MIFKGLLSVSRRILPGLLVSAIPSLAIGQMRESNPKASLSISPVRYAMQCGSKDAYIDSKGTVFEGDRPYGSGFAPYRGYVGGVRIRSQIFVSGTNDEPLYKSSRVGFSEYRFDVPFPGSYIVSLHFNELLYQGRNQDVFSLDFEGVRLIDSLDVWDRVLKDYAMIIRVPVTVTDGTLNVSLSASAGPGTLSAISVISANPDSVAPTSPQGLQVTGSYLRNVLTWNESTQEDVAGYNVYRLVNGNFVKLNAGLVFIERFFDDLVQPGLSETYAVSAVDVWGNESGPSSLVNGTALDHSLSNLPVYSIAVDPLDIDLMNDNWFENVFIDTDFVASGNAYPGSQVRYRGNFSRLNAKKSWKVSLPPGLDFLGRDRINLNSMSTDTAMLREKLGMDLFGSVGIPSANTEFVHFVVNDVFGGVFLDVEDMSSEFIDRVGLNTEGTLYRGDDTLKILPDAWTYDLEYEKETNQGGGVKDIVRLIELINNLDDEEFEAAAHQFLNVEEIMTYYSIVILIGRNDFTYSDYYMFYDPAIQKWSMLPWDNDETFGLIGGARDGYVFRYDLPIDFGTADSSEIAGNDRPHELLTRLARVPAFRKFFCDRLVTYIINWFKPSIMNPAIDLLQQSIAFDAERDMLKWGREDSTVFDGGDDEMKFFVANRGPFLLGEVPGYCPAPNPYLSLNELMPINQSTLGDEFGEFEPYFELFNGSLETRNLGGFHITDDPGQLTKWTIPSGVTMAPSSWLIFWADGDLGQGSTHTPPLLSPTGGELILVDAAGSQVLSRLTYGALGADQSHGLIADGGTSESPLDATPEFANFRLPLPPTISQVQRDIPWPGPLEDTTVTALVVDDVSVASVLLWYRIDDVTSFTEMRDDGASGDGVSGDGVYGGLLPGQPGGSIVRYFLEAFDNRGMSTREPLETPSVLYEFEAGQVPPLLFINEFLASNSTVNQDEVGDFDDWLEIYNGDTVSVDLSGMYLSDDLSTNDKWQIPSGTILAPGAWLLVWADDEPNDGPLHATFKLSGSGEEIGLFHTDSRGRIRIDSVVYGPQLTDVSFGRIPDGGAQWQFFPTPTPGGAN